MMAAGAQAAPRATRNLLELWNFSRRRAFPAGRVIYFTGLLPPAVGRVLKDAAGRSINLLFRACGKSNNLRVNSCWGDVTFAQGPVRVPAAPVD